MVHLTAKEYLNQAAALDALINARQEELHKLWVNASSVSGLTFGDRINSGKVNNSMSLVDKIIDLQNDINSEIDKLIDLKAEIRKRISRVCDARFIALLTDRYINGLTFSQIACLMKVDERTIYRWHGTALQIFRKENNMR